jgi:hypothetical protein
MIENAFPAFPSRLRHWSELTHFSKGGIPCGLGDPWRTHGIHGWLVVLPILKNMSQWEGFFSYLENHPNL